WRPSWPTGCPAKPSCNVSSAASSKPSTCAPDAEKACVSSPHPPRKNCSNHDNQRKPQCDDASKQLAMSVSTTHRDPCQDSSTGVPPTFRIADRIGSASERNRGVGTKIREIQARVP